MRFRVVLTEQVLGDVAAMQEWIVAAGAPRAAEQWTEQLLMRLRALEMRPRRYALAREAGKFPDVELRQMVFGRMRVLFAIVGRDVRVLHARHGSRQDVARLDVDAGNGCDGAREPGVAYVGYPAPAHAFTRAS